MQTIFIWQLFILFLSMSLLSSNRVRRNLASTYKNWDEITMFLGVIQVIGIIVTGLILS